MHHSQSKHAFVSRNHNNSVLLLSFVLALNCAVLSLESRSAGAAGNAVAPTEQSQDSQTNETNKPLSLEQKMQRRYPQPIRAGDLVGLPMLDWLDSTIGFIQQVVRTPAGKIQLIVLYRQRFGFIRGGGIFDWGRRPVAVPLEAVAILARQVNALDMSRKEFDAAPTFDASQAAVVSANEMISIAIARR
jgi:hypothetical protein